MTGLSIYPLLSYRLGPSHLPSSPELKISTVSARRGEQSRAEQTYLYITPLAQPFPHNPSYRLSLLLLPVAQHHLPPAPPAANPPCPPETTPQSKTTSTQRPAAQCPVSKTSGAPTSPHAAAAATGHVSAPAGPAHPRRTSSSNSPTAPRASSRSAPAWT